jgi:hypothetical protein
MAEIYERWVVAHGVIILAPKNALIAALKVKHNYPEAIISYVRKSNRRGDRRNPHRKE